MSNNILKNLFFSYIIAYGVFSLQTQINSNFFSEYLEKNLISLLIALLAINITTLGIILTKIKDLLNSRNLDGSYFKNTKKQMLLSIQEQIAIIVISTGLLILKHSTLVNNEIIKDFINVSLFACFSYAIFILYDTAKAVLDIIDF
ncbi:hypothetical protein [Caminibacter pacificus]